MDSDLQVTGDLCLSDIHLLRLVLVLFSSAC